jgi:hypothetical protein
MRARGYAPLGIELFAAGFLLSFRIDFVINGMLLFETASAVKFLLLLA